ncbi:MAG: DUF1284 domain-containing protein [Nitrospirae bacterium]|nr:DUF1284 domain-containing protein [Nitrospirota bacterium]
MLILRGHHLICLHFFSGEGYDTPFVENLRDIMKRAKDEEIEITSDADNICVKCPYLKGHKCAYDENADEEIKEMDKTALKFLNLGTRQKITWQTVKEYIPVVFQEWHDRYCNECNWKQACKKSDFYQEMKRR